MSPLKITSLFTQIGRVCSAIGKAKFLFTFIAILCCVQAYAQRIEGIISNEQGQALGYAAISLKGLGDGAAANADGAYALVVPAGQYTVLAQHVGYLSQEKQITIGPGERSAIHFVLKPQKPLLTIQDALQNIAFAEALVRRAIAAKDSNRQKTANLQANLYVKGQMKLRDYPNRILGNELYFDFGDTARTKQLYLSETIGRYSRSASPAREKTEVSSSLVTGRSDGYGLATTSPVSFYQNMVRLSDALNPRGFVSPLSTQAFAMYSYTYMGQFTDEGQKIHKIQVRPKRLYEPAFSGTINLVDGSFELHSVQLQMVKQQQLQLLDTLLIEQMMVPLGNAWVLRQQVIYPFTRILRFNAYGSFLQVYNRVNLRPEFPARFFDNTVLRYEDSASRKPFLAWDTLRPVPLQPEERADYLRKDSLSRISRSARWIDSTDRVRNRIKPVALIIKGFTLQRTRRNYTVFYPALLDAITYNTVEGLALKFSPEFTRNIHPERSQNQWYLSPHFQYGFSNKMFNAHLTGHYRWGRKYISQLGFSGGRRVFQFNNEQPIAARDNSSSTLLFENNWMKLYQAGVARLGFSQGISDGLTLYVQGEFQDRMPLENTAGFVLFNAPKRTYTPNRPYEISLFNMGRHQAFSTTAELAWQPGARYTEYPDRRINQGSKWPLVRLSYTQGLPNIFGSDVQYSKYRLRVDDVLRLGLGGRIEYNAALGGFLNKNRVQLPDYQHFLGNRSITYTPNNMLFLLANFYQFSNVASFYTQIHFDYHLSGLLTNKIPGFNKLNWFLVAGTNALYINNGTQYAEAVLGIENILKFVRVDYVWGFQNNGFQRSGIRITFSGLIAAKRDD